MSLCNTKTKQMTKNYNNNLIDCWHRNRILFVNILT